MNMINHDDDGNGNDDDERQLLPSNGLDPASQSILGIARDIYINVQRLLIIIMMMMMLMILIRDDDNSDDDNNCTCILHL